MKLCTVFHLSALGGVLFFGGAAARAAGAPTPADLIIVNAQVLTLNTNSPIAQALAVRGEVIIETGKQRQIERLKDPNTRVIDAHGGTVLPGFCDSHVHSYEAAVSELTPPPALGSIADALDYIRAQAAKTPTNSWIVLQRLYPTRVKEGRLPTKAELDAAAPRHPVYWDCGDLAVVNTRALQVARLSAITTVPPGTRLALDNATHNLTGLVYYGANLFKLPPIPAPAVKVRRAALKRLYQLYNQQGITSIGERRAEPAAIDLFRDLAKSGELTVRINCARFIEPGANIEDSATRLGAMTNAAAGEAPYGPTGAGDDWVRIGALEVQLDGDVRTGTAYLRTPWGIGPTYQITEPAYRGELRQDPEVLTAFFLKAAEQGWQLSADCTGDAALDQLLNCYQKVQFKMDIRQRRFIISRAGFQAAQDWSRCKQLGLGVDAQPAWLYRDGESLLKTLGERRLKLFLPFRSWFEQGIVVGGGSDHEAGLDSMNSCNPWNPWLGLWIALARQTDGGAEVVPGEKLSREQAIRLYTINNAWLNFEETKKGSLEAGKLADLILVNKDILKCAVEDVRDTKVLLTVVGGKIVWETK